MGKPKPVGYVIRIDSSFSRSKTGMKMMCAEGSGKSDLILPICYFRHHWV